MSYTKESAQSLAERHGECCVLDVRTPAEVAGTHLPGSLHLPLQELGPERVRELVDEAGHSGRPIYLLCQSGKRAEMAAQKLAGQIDEPLVIVEGGVNALAQTDAPLAKGQSNVISLERQVRITAGALVLAGVVAGALLHPGFYALSGFVGAGLMFAGITDTCAMGMLLARMSWNRKA